MEHFICNLYPAIAAAINRGDDYFVLLAQEAVEPLVQSVVAILAASIPTKTFEDIASIATELALPTTNQMKAFAASAFVYVYTISARLHSADLLSPRASHSIQLQDAAQLTGIPQALHWAFHHIHNANRALVNWVWKGSQTPAPKRRKKRARKPRQTATTPCVVPLTTSLSRGTNTNAARVNSKRSCARTSKWEKPRISTHIPVRDLPSLTL